MRWLHDSGSTIGAPAITLKPLHLSEYASIPPKIGQFIYMFLTVSLLDACIILIAFKFEFLHCYNTKLKVVALPQKRKGLGGGGGFADNFTLWRIPFYFSPQPLMLWVWNFVTFIFYLFAMFLQSFFIRHAINI